MHSWKVEFTPKRSKHNFIYAVLSGFSSVSLENIWVKLYLTF
jgi:hypothetical protein